MKSIKVKNDRNVIEEVCLLRLILICFLVLYHSFAPYVGVWKAIPVDPEVSNLYWWIGKWSYSFLLECFTFISGWVFGYQVFRRGKELLDGRIIIKRKLKRLIIPSLIFSFIYIILLKPSEFTYPLHAIWHVVNGIGHMWYLPMLMWCFVGIYMIEKRKLNIISGVFLCIILFLLSFIPIPLRLSEAMRYMLFFYVGYLIGRKTINVTQFAKPVIIIIICLLYLICFFLVEASFIPLLNLIIDNSPTLSSLNNVALIARYEIRNLGMVLYSVLGLSFVTLLSIYLIKMRYLNLPVWIINLTTYSFGIYIFQQFILQIIYYHTPYIRDINPVYIPWMAFIVTMALSIVMAIVFRKFRFGRFLLG